MFSITGHGRRRASDAASDAKIRSSHAIDRRDNAMPPDETLVNRVRTAVGQSRHVEEKKMFGGIAFMVDGKMCG
jgi:hypothetical protein